MAVLYNIGARLITFLITQIVPENDGEIAINLQNWYTGQTTFAGVLFLIICAIFEEKPKNHSSPKEKVDEHERVSMTFSSSLKKTMNPNFILLLIVITLNFGTYLGMSNASNLIFTHFFRDKVNILGLIEIFGGLVASITTLLFGYLLDKKKCFKTLYTLVTLASMVSYAAYYISLNAHLIWLTFIFGVFIAFLVEIYIALAILAVVINNSVQESITASFVTIAEQIGATAFTFVITAIVNNISILFAYIFIVSVLFINCLLIMIVKEKTCVKENEPNDGQQVAAQELRNM
ncbi:feline leukemia virus subgroup C receptor-related protein 2-like protein [Leptotrombidium deliense]|uniref:Feline leukemia virus subgroup C receptor-related protein 2-like protein n=1 Tax=Leptotrombidium deliense TaxID=299467 RepID=A0A443S0C0_9ACAR|nr:feline leukemia virus subgroup C receptor-related protein 2-like protein [Leptotrombidium deliense]